MEWVCYDNNMINVSDTNYLIDTTLDSKYFGFGGCDVDSSVNCLDDGFIISVNIWYWHGNMILDASI